MRKQLFLLILCGGFLLLTSATTQAQIQTNNKGEAKTTLANGSDVNSGLTTDAAVSGDVNGTISAKLRQLNKIFTLSWDGTSRINTTTASGVVTAGTAAWTSGTSNDATVSIAVTGYSTVAVSFNPSGSITAGTLNFEASDDGGTIYYSIGLIRADGGGVEQTFGMNAATKKLWQGQASGFTNVRVRLNPVITGAGTANIRIQASNAPLYPWATVAFAAQGLNSTGAELQPNVMAGILDDTSPQTVTENQFGNLRMSSKGVLYNQIRDAAGNERGANVDSSNRLSVTVDNALSVTANAGTNLNTSALSLETTQTDVRTSVQLLDDAIHAANAAFSKAIAIGGQMDDTSTVVATENNISALRITAQRGLHVNLRDNSGGELGVSATPLRIDPTGTTTQPVSLASVPSHAVTNAGTFAVQATLAAETTKVLGTVRTLGNGGATLDATIGAATAPTNMLAVGGVYNSTKPTLTNGQSAALQLDTKGNQQTVVRDAAGNDRGANVNSSNQLSVSVDNSNVSTNIAQINGVTPLMGAGNTGTGSPRVTIASDQAAIPVTESGTWTVQPGNTANTTAWITQPVPGATNGASTCVVQSAASTNATNCKASAGLLYGLEVVNTTSTIYYLRVYNLSSSPTCSSATGFVRTIPIPHGSGAGAGIANFYTVGETYGTGIGFCLTGGGSSTDNTSAAVGVYISLHYK